LARGLSGTQQIDYTAVSIDETPSAQKNAFEQNLSPLCRDGLLHYRSTSSTGKTIADNSQNQLLPTSNMLSIAGK
jgi:hypothetical protein